MLSFNPPCGEAVGRGTAPVGRGGGAATSRHCPSVSASRCHLPIAARQGGSLCPYRSFAATPSFRSCRAKSRHPSILRQARWARSEEHTSELQSLMRTSYAVFCLKKKKQKH